MPYDEVLRSRVAAVPDATIAELRAWVFSEHKIKVGTPVFGSVCVISLTTGQLVLRLNAIGGYPISRLPDLVEGRLAAANAAFLPTSA
jgi:hypothetical protein